MKEILCLIATPFVAMATHEGGHYLAARFYGHKIKFRFSWGKLWGKEIVPRYIWNMPKKAKKNQKNIIALAGFGTEFLIAAIIWIATGFWPLFAFSAAHLAAYPYYAGEANDFKWLMW